MVDVIIIFTVWIIHRFRTVRLQTPDIYRFLFSFIFYMILSLWCNIRPWGFGCIIYFWAIFKLGENEQQARFYVIWFQFPSICFNYLIDYVEIKSNENHADKKVTNRLRIILGTYGNNRIDWKYGYPCTRT